MAFEHHISNSLILLPFRVPPHSCYMASHCVCVYGHKPFTKSSLLIRCLCSTIPQGATTTVDHSCPWLSHETSQVWLSSCFPGRIRHWLWGSTHSSDLELSVLLPTRAVSAFIISGNSHQISPFSMINKALWQQSIGLWCKDVMWLYIRTCASEPENLAVSALYITLLV